MSLESQKNIMWVGELISENFVNIEHYKHWDSLNGENLKQDKPKLVYAKSYHSETIETEKQGKNLEENP